MFMQSYLQIIKGSTGNAPIGKENMQAVVQHNNRQYWEQAKAYTIVFYVYAVS